MSDSSLKKWILEEFDWDPKVDASHIGVSVEDGAVTLSGHVSAYAEKWAAGRAAARVAGVKAIADEIRVHQFETHRVDDSDIAKRIAHVLDWNVNIPKGSVQARVSNGNVILTGKVEWDEQRRHVEKQIRHVGGVLGIANGIEIDRKPTPTNIATAIERAMNRHAELDASDVRVNVDGNTVVLSGSVPTLPERDIAHRAAWTAPGVQAVIDEIQIAA